MRTLKLTFIFIFVATMIANCSSDDNTSVDEKTESGYFIYDGEEYPLKAGYIDNEGNQWTDDGSTEYEISLMSSDFTVSTEGEIITIDKLVHMLDFVIYSEDDQKPKIGIYKYNDYLENDFICSEVYGYLDVNYEEDDYLDEDLYATSGMLEILQSGSIFEIKFEFENYNNKPIVGYYKGELLTQD